MFQEKLDQIIKAWKDPEYRNSLSAEERAQLPQNPVGEVTLAKSELNQIFGGSPTINTCNYSICFC